LHSSADYSKNRKEFEAELTAFLVCKKLGIDTSRYSFEYLAIFGDLAEKEFEKAVDTSIKTADVIINSFSTKTKVPA
ncbi:MAG: hypothetical protein ABGX17_04435, partial [Desulfurobacteriaceae bacterium]